MKKKIHLRVLTSFETFAVFWIFYTFFWVIPLRLNYVCRRFGTLRLFYLRTQLEWIATGGEKSWGIFTGERMT